MRFRLNALFVATAVVCVVAVFFWHSELPEALKGLVAFLVLFVILTTSVSALANSVG